MGTVEVIALLGSIIAIVGVNLAVLVPMLKAQSKAMSARFTAVDSRLDRMDTRFDRLDHRVDKLESDLRADIKALNDNTFTLALGQSRIADALEKLGSRTLTAAIGVPHVSLG